MSASCTHRALTRFKRAYDTTTVAINVTIANTITITSTITNPPTLGRNVRSSLGERFTFPLTLSAWGSDLAGRQMHEKTRLKCQNSRFIRTQRGVLEDLEAALGGKRRGLSDEWFAF